MHMPFYEYECSACQFYVETMQKISEPPLKKCPSCGKPTLKRLISAPVFRLKGAGWYETDFKSDKENKRNLVDDKEPASKSDSDDKKTTVRASKALKKAVAKKTARKPAGKTKKPSRAPVKAVRKSVKKAPSRKKAVKKAAAKRPARPAARKK
jgi:putative FmdB family regulatory protein